MNGTPHKRIAPRSRIGEADAELIRITTEILPAMMKKQAARRKELERQETLARCSNVCVSDGANH